MKKSLGMLLALWLCGCETVVFETPPVAAQPCDPALVGNWLSVGDRPGADGEVELRIAADCALTFVEHEHGAARAGESTSLHVGRDGRLAYAWVDARWAERRMALDPDKARTGTPAFAAGDIVLMRYRISGRRLDVHQADPKRFAHRVIDEDIAGELARTKGGDLTVRVLAPVDPRRLRDASLFPRGDLRFERARDDG